MDTDKSDSPNQQTIAGMEGLQSAIANGEINRVKQLLTHEMLDELQKQHLIELAKSSNQSEIAELLDNTPAKP